VAERHGANPSPADILKVAELISVDTSIVHRQVLRMNTISLTATYFREFRLGGATFLGSEVWVSGIPVDLLWRWCGRFWIDELKTGFTAARSRSGLEEQVQDQWERGSAEFGQAFGGVRAVVISRPRSSFHLNSKGSRLVGMPS
jgi:hypothetical protein